MSAAGQLRTGKLVIVLGNPQLCRATGSAGENWKLENAYEVLKPTGVGNSANGSTECLADGT